MPEVIQQREVIPIYAPVKGFQPALGERIRLSSHATPATDFRKLTEMGVNLFFGRTDNLRPLDSKDANPSLETLFALRQQVLDAGGSWGMFVSTAFPSVDELRGGSGVVNILNGNRVPAWSPWDTERFRWSGQKFSVINRRFPNLEAVVLGIFGNYGDAFFFSGLSKQDPVMMSEWKSVFNTEPPDSGLWVGDEHARMSWTRKIEREYGSLDKALLSWGLDPEHPPRSFYPYTQEYPYHARLEFWDWYKQAIPYVASTLSGMAKEVFLRSSVLVPFGPPNDQPFLGVDAFTTLQALKNKADAVVLSNIGFYEFTENWAMTLGRIRGASRKTEMPLWTSSASQEGIRDFNRRLFESLSLGTKGHIDWEESWMLHSSLIGGNYEMFIHRQPRCGLAIIHPSSTHNLRLSQPVPPLMYRGLVELRDYLDFDVLEESAIIQGALSSYPVAAVFEGTIWKSQTLTAIKNWVDEGGVLIVYNFGRMGDERGDVKFHNDLFSYANNLTPARIDEKWVGQIPERYSVRLDEKVSEELLRGRWGAVKGDARPALNDAEIRLPVHGDSDVFVEIRFANAQQEVGELHIIVNDRRHASLSLSGGGARFQINVRKEDQKSGMLRVVFSGMQPEQEALVQSIVVSKEGADGEVSALSGWMDAPLTPAQIKQWTRGHGKGMTIYFPAQRDQWKAFLTVIRHAVYRIDQIDSERKPYPLIDDVRDGVFATDLGDALLFWNSNAQKGEITVIDKNNKSHKIELAPNEIHLLNLQPEYFLKVFWKEHFITHEGAATDEGIFLKAGEKAVVRFEVPQDGRYRIFCRSEYESRPVPVKISYEFGELRTTRGGWQGDLSPVGDFEFESGMVEITITAETDTLITALVVTQDPRIVGFRLKK